MFIKKDKYPFTIYRKFMEIGKLPFGKSADTSKDYLEGVVISYRDSKGVLWSSDAGVGDQSTSNFEIADRFQSELSASGIIIGKFNCTLYDGSGNSIPLLNGQFSAYAIFLRLGS